jgi:hypothetical protein
MANFTSPSGPFAVRVCSVATVRSLSATRQSALQFAFAAEEWSLLIPAET